MKDQYRNTACTACTDCGRRSQRNHPLCLDCYLITRPSAGNYDPDIPLSGGRWQADHMGIQRYIKGAA